MLTRNQTRADEQARVDEQAQILDRSEGSPPWDCEDGPLPSANAGSASPDSEEIDHSSTSDPEESGKQATNARSPYWQPWEDRFLASEVEKHRPFLASRPGTKILEVHWKNETRSLQKTGTDEDINTHIQNMTDITALIDSHVSANKELSNVSKAKANREHQGSLELRIASMTGVVPRNTLTDVTEGMGASHQEKQAQRKRKHSTRDSEANKENCSLGPSKRLRKQTAMEKALDRSEQDVSSCLDEVQIQDRQRHEQLLNGFDRMAQSIEGLSECLKAQTQRESIRNDQQTELLKLMNSLVQNRNN
ncbi:hypothetical protein M422DRAFT_276327 [Sphaerobolus stellatus SS14]|uniref:Unplaced genomic scaffold SPHSTscaffold_706, whole genome shotgun sequence n=1 Tax=Sphaerobolus stellatus (strain SS14) TaxID=990650 RepID=A0A0C9UCG7_SPHS4|nr:hypothetical protein M422DRAFT_276327 [Sphaerobolus stellatus SS14]